MGGMHLSIAYSLWPKWLSKHKDVGETKKKKTKVEKKRGGTPSTVLARSLSLRRANARAKASRLENSRDHNYDQNVSQHRFSQSIEALYILSKIKEDGLGWLDTVVDRPGYLREKIVTCRSTEEDLWDGKVAPNGRDDIKSIVSCRVELQKGLHGRGDAVDSEVPGERGGRKDVHRRTSLSASLPPEISGSVKDSVPLVKYSYDPYMDFRDSMMQMIRDNNILDTPSDLEDLLYCYFSLNSPGHYDCIRDAFRDICKELESKL